MVSRGCRTGSTARDGSCPPPRDRHPRLGCLLKDGFADVREFLDALERLEAGCTVLDAEIVTEAVARSRPRDRLRSLTGREREVLTLMAEGRTNAAIASGLTTLVGDGRATAILGAWGAAAIGIGVWTFRRRDA